MNGKREDIAPRKDLGVRRDLAPRKDLKIGSRPPPSKRPSTSSLSILFVMAFVLVGAFVASGNLLPVDPNGPGGPPTLQPYYNPDDYPIQHIVTPTGGFVGSKKNLQLETFDVDNCGENSVILFVIDTSGSMKFFGKIGNEKKALTYFTNNMGGLSAIGIDTFGKKAKGVKELLPLTYFKAVKSKVKSVINGLTPDGYTPTRDAMELARRQLKKSITNEDYPGYKYNLVIMTDGVPEQEPPRSCYATTYDPNTAPLPRCFSKEQDPLVPTNIVSDIKDLGVDVYVINVYSPLYHSDAVFYPLLTSLLTKMASKPLDTHYFLSINGGNLNQILTNIGNSICYNKFNGVPQPTH